MNSIKVITGSLDVSTRGKRRKAMSLVIVMLEKIRNAEEEYMLRMPLNFQLGEAYSAADQSVDAIIEAVDYLSDAY